MTDQHNAQTIADLAVAATPVITQHGGAPVVRMPQGTALQSLEQYLPNPLTKKAKVVLKQADSLVEYLAKHKTEGATTLYAEVDYDQSKCCIKAVINDHSTYTPGWRNHVAEFNPTLTHEWQKWTAHNGKAMTQTDFAAFIEDNLADIATVADMPTATQMLEMALNFELTSEKKYKRKVDLQTGGTHLEFVDQADEASSAKILYFKRFTLGIPVLLGSTSAYPIEARLKFRQASGGLQFWYELVRPDRVYRQAIDEVLEHISQQSGLPILYGAPGL